MNYQIYLFSSFFLLQTGIRLSKDKFGALLKYETIFSEDFLTNNTLKTISGILSILFGILQILQPIGVAVIGDIIPALFNLVGGLALIVQVVNKEYEGENSFLKWSHKFINTNIAIIGVLMLIVGVIHAVFPSVILL